MLAREDDIDIHALRKRGQSNAAIPQPELRPTLADLAIAAADMDGSHLAEHPDLIRRAAQTLTSRPGLTEPRYAAASQLCCHRIADDDFQDAECLIYRPQHGEVPFVELKGCGQLIGAVLEVRTQSLPGRPLREHVSGVIACSNRHQVEATGESTDNYPWQPADPS